MYRQCDRCKGIFKIPSAIGNYIINNNNKIYCTYCNSPHSHIYIKRFNDGKLESKRGDLLF